MGGSPIELATIHWLWKETVNRLERFQLQADQGENLDAGVSFARYVLFSQLDTVLKPFDNSGPLKVDSSFLRWKAEELQRTVCDIYRTGKARPATDSTQLEAINRKLDLIAGRLSQVPIAEPVPVVVGPKLEVIEGGL